MVKLRIAFVFIVLIFVTQNSFSKEFGKVIYITGKPLYVAMDTGEKLPIKYGTIIKTGRRLITRPKSSVQILMTNGSTIDVKGNSMLSFFNIKTTNKDEPTKIDFQYGKIKISLKPIFDDIAIRIYTPTSIISAMDSDFSIISAYDESKVLVHRNKIGISNRTLTQNKAYLVKAGIETTIIRNFPMPTPKKLKLGIALSWFHQYSISYNRKKIILTNTDSGIIDWLLRKREF